MRKTTPVEVEKNGDREYHSHPSWMKVSVSRVQGSTRLFGSGVNHQHFFRIRLQPCDVCVDLRNTWYFGKARHLVEFDMTPAQFLELFSNIGMGDGTHATLNYLDGKEVPQAEDLEPREVDQIKGYARESMKKRMGEVRDATKVMTERLRDPKPLKKDEKVELIRVLEKCGQGLENNFDFYVDEFENATDKLVQQAKQNIESFVTTTLVSKGVEALNKESFQLRLEDSEE